MSFLFSGLSLQDEDYQDVEAIKLPLTYALRKIIVQDWEVGLVTCDLLKIRSIYICIYIYISLFFLLFLCTMTCSECYKEAMPGKDSQIRHRD